MIVIDCQNLSRNFKLQKKSIIFEALKNISFELEEGKVLGIIGKNGAGKSTLMKILSQIIPPSSGEVRIKGKVAPLLEVGTGFHPDLSGKENIFLNGTLLGMKKKDIQNNLEEIISFSGLENFINEPLKKYSSGMKVKLGFSVAAHLNSEILLMDEILAVGDMEFQKKCFSKMENLTQDKGRSIIFISHNMTAIKSLCDRVLVLEKGTKVFESNSTNAVQFYTNSSNEYLSNGIIRGEEYLHEKRKTFNLKSFESQKISDELMSIKILVESFEKLKDFRVKLGFTNDSIIDNVYVTLQTDDHNLSSKSYETGYHEFTCLFPLNDLGTGSYLFNLELIHPYIEHQIFHKIFEFEHQYQGNSNVFLGNFENAFKRPNLKWGHFYSLTNNNKE